MGDISINLLHIEGVTPDDFYKADELRRLGFKLNTFNAEVVCVIFRIKTSEQSFPVRILVRRAECEEDRIITVAREKLAETLREAVIAAG